MLTVIGVLIAVVVAWWAIVLAARLALFAGDVVNALRRLTRVGWMYVSGVLSVFVCVYTLCMFHGVSFPGAVAGLAMVWTWFGCLILATIKGHTLIREPKPYRIGMIKLED